MSTRAPLSGVVTDELGRLREQAAGLMRDRVMPAMPDVTEAVASPFRRALEVLVPLVSQYGGVAAELLQTMRNKAGRVETLMPQRPAVSGTRTRVIRVVAVSGAVLAIGFAAYALGATRTSRRRVAGT